MNRRTLSLVLITAWAIIALLWFYGQIEPKRAESLALIRVFIWLVAREYVYPYVKPPTKLSENLNGYLNL